MPRMDPRSKLVHLPCDDVANWIKMGFNPITQLPVRSTYITDDVRLRPVGTTTSLPASPLSNLPIDYWAAAPKNGIRGQWNKEHTNPLAAMIINQQDLLPNLINTSESQEST